MHAPPFVLNFNPGRKRRTLGDMIQASRKTFLSRRYQYFMCRFLSDQNNGMQAAENKRNHLNFLDFGFRHSLKKWLRHDHQIFEWREP
jgi:hypothetical protein